MMSAKSDISDLSSTSSMLNIAKSEIMNTSFILNPDPIEYCLTKFNFEASKNDELSFKANQYIRLTKKVDGGWWEGKLDERIGWFPSDFVTLEIEPQKLQELTKNDKALSTEEMSVLKYKNIVFNRSQLKLSDLDDGGIEISESEFVRNEITKDLIHTEEAYIEDIRNFTTQIINPMENESWISYADRNDMFGRIPWLSNLHVCLTSELKSALNQPEEKNLGNCFSCVIQNFEIVYSDYFSSFPRAIYVASQYSSNNKMTTFLVNAGCQSLPPILHILSFLHKPIQRISKYSPVLSELLHFTKPEDPGFDELVDMVTKFKQLEGYLKTLKETAEKQERLKNLYNSIEDWVGPGIENYGELLLESKVHILDPTSSSTTPKTHFIYLLEKLFVVLKPITKTDNTKYNLVASVPVWKGTLSIVNDVNDLNTFQVIFLPSEQSNKLKSLVITVSKPDVKKQWIETVKKQLDKNVRLTLPSLPKEVQEDLTANDTSQSKKKWKKLVPKFARTKGKTENTLPPYTSSNLLLKTSEGGTLISSELSNLEHKIITEEKRKQGELLKMKYQEMSKNEESLDSQAINDYSSGVTTQGYNTPMYDNIETLPYGRMSHASTTSTSTCSSASSKMTTICTKYNAVERNAYNYDNTSFYSEGTAYTGVNTSFNNINNNLQMTRMTNEVAFEEEADDEFDMMMGGGSSSEEEEEDEQASTVPTIPPSFKEDASELNQPEQIHLGETMTPFSMDTTTKPPLENQTDVSATEQSQTYINPPVESVTVPTDRISSTGDNVGPVPLESTTNEPLVDAVPKEPAMNPTPIDPSLQEIKKEDAVEPSSTVKEDFNTSLEKPQLGLTKKDSFDTFIAEDMKSFDTSSIRQVKTNTWFSEDSKSETEELKRSVNPKESLHYQSSKEDIHKDTDVNILLELEELEKKNKHRKNELSEISSITSLKSVQMISKQFPSAAAHSHDDSHHHLLRPEIPQYSNHHETMVREDETSDDYHKGVESPVQQSTSHHMYKNKNIVKEDLSTLLTSTESTEEKEKVTDYVEPEDQQPLPPSSSPIEANIPEINIVPPTTETIESSTEAQKEISEKSVTSVESTEKKDTIINKIIEAKIAQEIKEKCGDISNKDLTIKIRINEEDSSNDINIEIKINRNTDDKIPEVTIETEKDANQEESSFKVISEEDKEKGKEPEDKSESQEINSEPVQEITEKEELIENQEPKENQRPESLPREEQNQESTSAKDMATQTIENPTVHENTNSMVENASTSVEEVNTITTANEPISDNTNNYLHNLISSPSTIATEATDATLSMMANEDDKFQIQAPSRSMDSYESRTTFVDSSLDSVDIPKSHSQDDHHHRNHEHHLSAVTEMKKYKSPLLSALSPLSSPVVPQVSLSNDEHIVEYGLLEKQFKFFLSRNHLQVNERKDTSRYSDSFVRYQNVNFKKESEVRAAEQEQDKEHDTEEPAIIFTENDTPLTLTKRFPSTLFNRSHRASSNNLRSISDSYQPKKAFSLDTSMPPVIIKTSPSVDDPSSPY